jgi:type II secretory pathway component GspD/PulD (secretin)
MRSLPLLACFLFASLAVAQPPDIKAAKPPAKQAEPKRFAVSFQEKPWKDVFAWLTEQTGKPVIAPGLPTGTFTLVSPQGRTFTLAEIIDCINDALMSKHFLLCPHERTFTVAAADEKIDPGLMRTRLVRAEELAGLPRTEIVLVMVPLKTYKAEDLLPSLKKLTSPFGGVGVLGERLIVQDMAGNVSQILKLLKEIEGQTAEAPRPAAGAGAMLRTYQVPGGQAEAIVRTLQEAYRNTPAVRISAVSRNTILVYGSPEDHLDIARQLQGAEQPAQAVTQLIPLVNLQANRTVETLRAMFFGAGGPYLEADPDRNAIIVRGTREQLQEIMTTLEALGEKREGPARSNVRIIEVQGGNAATLAEALQKLLNQMRPNPVRVIVPGQKEEVPPKGPEAKDQPKAPPVTLTAIGNKLLVACDDPEVLALVQEMTRLLTQKHGEGDFEVIRLKAGNAIEVAKVLDEAFNGPMGNAKLARIRVVPDPVTNSLLVRATPLDMLVIKHLIRVALDAPRDEARPEIQTWTIPLKNATAPELAKVILLVYRGEEGRPIEPGFTIGSDPRSNTLILRSSPNLYKDIVKLVEQLDGKAPPK